MRILNKNIGIIITIIILFIGIILSITNNKTSIKNNDSKGKTIVAFGDSLIQGIGTATDKNFISLLAKNTGESIINLGRSGDTTETALTRIDTVLDQNPKLVLILLGGNDYLRKIPIDQTFSNLGQIIQKIQDNGSAVILLGIRGGILFDQFENRFEKLSNTYETGYVPDVLKGLIDKVEFMSDPIHPNEKGYFSIYKKVEPEFLKIMKQIN